jgi:hypothetical protein
MIFTILFDKRLYYLSRCFSFFFFVCVSFFVCDSSIVVVVVVVVVVVWRGTVRHTLDGGNVSGVF